MSTPMLLFELGPLLGSPADGEVAAGIFALDVAHVLLVTEADVVMPVPLAPSVVDGVLNHHGRIVTLVDPAPLLGLETQPEPVAQVVILRRHSGAGGQVGLKVQRTREIVGAATLEEAEVPPGPCIQRVLRQDSHLVHVISHDALLMELNECFEHPVQRRGTEAQGVR